MSKKGFISRNGFSCLIRGTEKTILFDTGGDGSILLYNMQQAKVNPKSVDVIVISHEHGDHKGGLPAFLSFNNKVSIYLPSILSSHISHQISLYGPKLC